MTDRNFYAPIGITTDGDVECVDLRSSSDRELKQNIRPIADALVLVNQLNGVRFEWRDRPDHDNIGLIAQEVQQVFPELVSARGDGTLTVNYQVMTAVLIEAVKELTIRVSELEAARAG